MKNKRQQTHIGNILYLEWIKPILDYYLSLKWKYCNFEILLPLIVGVACAFIYETYGNINHALKEFSDILISAISILIGFTTMLITLLLTSSGNNVDKLKQITTEQKLNGKDVSLHQLLHIQFSHSLYSEIELLLFIFLYRFLNGIDITNSLNLLNPIFLAVFTFYTLNILLSILRGIANIYFSFYKSDKNLK